MNDTFSTKIEYLQRQVADLKSENRHLQSQLLEQDGYGRANADLAFSVTVTDDGQMHKLRLSEIDRALADSQDFIQIGSGSHPSE